MGTSLMTAMNAEFLGTTVGLWLILNLFLLIWLAIRHR